MAIGFQRVKDVAARAVKKVSNQLMNFVAVAFGRVLAACLLAGCKFNAAAKKFLGQSENYTENAAGAVACLPACWQHRLPLPDVAAVFVGAIIMTLLFFFFSVLYPLPYPFWQRFWPEATAIGAGWLKLSKQKLCFVATVNMQRTKCSQTN